MTDELDGLRAENTRLREALEAHRVENLRLWTTAAQCREALGAVEWRRIEDVHGTFNECPWCEWVDVDGHADDCQRQAALSPADDWLAQHDAEVRRGERERCAGKCDDIAESYTNIPENGETGPRAAVATFCKNTAKECAATIREADDE